MLELREFLYTRLSFASMPFHLKLINSKPLVVAAIATLSLKVLTACTNPSQPPLTTSPEASPTTQMMAEMNHSAAMDLGPSDAEYDLRFIDAMFLHHQGAIAMAKVAMQNSQRPEIKKLSNAIIDAQSREIADLQTWRKNWYPQAGSKPVAYDSQMGHSMEMNSEQIKAMRMDIDLGAADEEFDRRFVEAMIVHHEGALAMAESALRASQRSEIQELSQAILDTQAQEISQMQEWLKAWYN